MAFGGVTVCWAIWVIVKHKTGWGLTTAAEEEIDWARISLSLLLSGMFFFLVGSGIVLISRYELGGKSDPNAPPPRWAKPVAWLLFITGSGSIGLATLFAGMRDDFGEYTAGIVSYCMLIGVGLLFSGWGLKRAGDREEDKPQG